MDPTIDVVKLGAHIINLGQVGEAKLGLQAALVLVSIFKGGICKHAICTYITSSTHSFFPWHHEINEKLERYGYWEVTLWLLVSTTVVESNASNVPGFFLTPTCACPGLRNLNCRNHFLGVIP